MERFRQSPPYDKIGEFEVDPPRLGRMGEYRYACAYFHGQVRKREAFIVFFTFAPPETPGQLPSGDCARTTPNPLHSEKRYLTVDGRTRQRSAHAVGGDRKILLQALARAEARGVGRACPKR